METLTAQERDVVVLFDAVAADAEAADHLVAAIEWHAARKPDDAALIQVVAVAAAARARAFRAHVLRVVDVEIEPGPVLALGVVLLELFLEIDPRRKE